MMSIQLSFIVPMYNSSEYLLKTLKSITEMVGNSKGVEVILLDDGSSDNTVEIAESFIRNKNYFCLYKLDHQGVSAVRNKGIELANGDYVTFIDSDDAYERNSANDIINLISTSYPDILMLDIETIEEDKEFNNVTIEDRINLIYLCSRGRGNNGISSKFYSKRFIDNNRLFFDDDIVIAEDALYIYRAICKAESILISNLEFYKILKSHSLNRFNPKILSSEMKFREELDDIFSELYKYDSSDKLLWTDNKIKFLNFLILLKQYYTPLFLNKDMFLNDISKEIGQIVEKYGYSQAFESNRYDSLIGIRDKIWRLMLKKRLYKSVILVGVMIDKIKNN